MCRVRGWYEGSGVGTRVRCVGSGVGKRVLCVGCIYYIIILLYYIMLSYCIIL